MLKLIFTIGGTPEDLALFKENLENVIIDVPADAEVICLVDESQREKARVEAEKMLTREVKNLARASDLTFQWVDSQNGESLSRVKEFIHKKDTVFICNGKVVFPSGGLKLLLEDSVLHPRAGVNSGYLGSEPPYYRVKDVYAEKLEWTHASLVENGLVRIDAVPFYGVITRGREFLRYYKDDDGGARYCLRLRRIGYENFLDTRVRYRVGGF